MKRFLRAATENRSLAGAFLVAACSTPAPSGTTTNDGGSDGGDYTVVPPKDGGGDSGKDSGTSGKWTKVPGQLSTQRGLFTSLPHAITSKDGRVLFVGGGSSAAKNTVDIYTNGALAAGTALNTARQQPGVVVLADGSVLAVGGNTGGSAGTALSSIERWDSATGAWTALTSSLSKARAKVPLARMSDGRIFAVGGEVSSASFATEIELIDPSQNFAVWTAGTMTTARSGHVGAPLPDGRILIAGGATGTSSGTSTEIFTPGATGTTGTIAAGPAMANAHSGTNASVLTTGAIMIAGGCTGGASCAGTSALCDVYTPVTGQAGTFASVASLGTASAAHAMILLPTGRILVAGGYDGTGALTRVEIYDPATNTWTVAASLNESRYDAGIAITSDGKVLIAGGRTGSISTATFLYSAEMFDPGLPTSCKICQLDGSCLTLATGTACDDGSPSTTGETCKANGTCAP